MISLLNNNQASRALKNAVMGLYGIPQNPKGTVIEYHQGDWADLIGTTAVGKQARALYDLGRVELVQSRIGGGRFSYRAVVK